MQSSVRKNFAFNPIVAEHLEELAKNAKTSLTQMVQELIEQRYEELEKQEKIKAAKSVAGSSSGIFGNLTIQEIKANMHV